MNPEALMMINALRGPQNPALQQRMLGVNIPPPGLPRGPAMPQGNLPPAVPMPQGILPSDLGTIAPPPLPRR